MRAMKESQQIMCFQIMVNGFLINNMKPRRFWMRLSQHDDLTTLEDQIKTINTIPEVQIAFEERSQKSKRTICTIMKNNTKIVATIGPASSSKEVLKVMIESGVNVCRLNFSHADYETHLKTIQIIKELNRELNVHTAILADLRVQNSRWRSKKRNGFRNWLRSFYYRQRVC